MQENNGNRAGIGLAIVLSVLGLLLGFGAWQRAGATEGENNSELADSYPVALDFGDGQLAGATLYYSFDEEDLSDGQVLGVQTENEPEQPEESAEGTEGETGDDAQPGGTTGTGGTATSGNTFVINNPIRPLGPNSVGSTEIQDRSVGGDDIAFNSIGSNELAVNSVGTFAIQDQSITGAKINSLTNLTVADTSTGSLNADGVFFVSADGSTGPRGEQVAVFGDLYVSGSIDPTDILFEPLVNGATVIDVRDVGGVVQVYLVDEDGNFFAAGDGDISGDLDLGSNLMVVGNASFEGNTVLGDGASDSVTVNGQIDSDLIPASTLTYSLGSATNLWNQLYVGTVNASNLTTATLTVTGESFHEGPEHYYADVDFGDGSDMYLLISSADGALSNPTTGVVLVDDSLSVDNNLAVSGDASFFGEVYFYDISNFYADMEVGLAEVFFRVDASNGYLSSPSTTTAGVTIDDNLIVNDDLVVWGDTRLYGETYAYDDFSVGLADTFLRIDASNGYISSPSTSTASVTIDDSLTVNNDLIVWGDSFHYGNESYYGYNYFYDNVYAYDWVNFYAPTQSYDTSYFYDDIEVGLADTFLRIDGSNGYISNPSTGTASVMIDDDAEITGDLTV